MFDLPFKIAIPSRNRALEILHNPLYGIAHVVVPDEDHVDEYRRAASHANITPGKFHVCGEHPSIAAKRDYILKEIWDPSEPFVFQVDDDFRAMRPTMHWRTVLVTNPEDIAAIFWETYISSSDAGSHVFGFAHKPDPKIRHAPTPVGLRGWVRGAVGISDRSLHYDDQLYLMEDLDICLASQAKDRIIWQDHRWVPHFGPSWAKGGIAHSRTEERRQQCYDRINQKYGPGTVKSRAGKSANLFSLRI